MKISKREMLKQEENEVFATAFLRLLEDNTLPKEIEHRTPPEPDLALKGSVTVGLEITRVHTDKGSKPSEAIQDRILQRACEIYGTLGRPCVSVRSAWFGPPPLPKREHEQFSTALAQFVASRIPPLGRWITFDSRDLPDPALPNGVDFITIDRMIDYQRSHWLNLRSGSVPDVSCDQIVARINAKNPKPATYRLPYDELILLLVIEGRGPSSFGSVGPAILNEPYKSTYDRVFILNLMEMKVFAVRVTAI